MSAPARSQVRPDAPRPPRRAAVLAPTLPADSLKLPLERDEKALRSWRRGESGCQIAAITASLPLYVGRNGRMVHRVRSGLLHHVGERHGAHHVSFSLWCGMYGFLRRGTRLLAAPPASLPICGTCEGRAVGAGQPSLAFLVQRHALLYTPRGAPPR